MKTVIPTGASRRLFFAFAPANASARAAEVLCAIARFLRDESLFDQSAEGGFLNNQGTSPARRPPTSPRSSQSQIATSTSPSSSASPTPNNTSPRSIQSRASPLRRPDPRATDKPIQISSKPVEDQPLVPPNKPHSTTPISAASSQG